MPNSHFQRRANHIMPGIRPHLVLRSTPDPWRAQFLRAHILRVEAAEIYSPPVRLLTIVGLSLVLWSFIGLFVSIAV